jgi:hypothetical protein
VRDHLADCLVTLPALAADGNPPSLHFFLGNLTSMRKEIFPGLEQAYAKWLATGETASLSAIAARGRNHWMGVARSMMDLHQEAGAESGRFIRELVDKSFL